MNYKEEYGLIEVSVEEAIKGLLEGKVISSWENDEILYGRYHKSITYNITIKELINYKWFIETNNNWYMEE